MLERQEREKSEYLKNYFCSCGDVAGTYHDNRWWCSDCAYELETGAVPNYTVHQFGKFKEHLTPRQKEKLEDTTS